MCNNVNTVNIFLHSVFLTEICGLKKSLLIVLNMSTFFRIDSHALSTSISGIFTE